MARIARCELIPRGLQSYSKFRLLLNLALCKSHTRIPPIFPEPNKLFFLCDLPGFDSRLDNIHFVHFFILYEEKQNMDWRTRGTKTCLASSYSSSGSAR